MTVSEAPLWLIGYLGLVAMWAETMGGLYLRLKGKSRQSQCAFQDMWKAMGKYPGHSLEMQIGLIILWFVWPGILAALAYALSIVLIILLVAVIVVTIGGIILICYDISVGGIDAKEA
jgi:hypothetical protein